MIVASSSPEAREPRFVKQFLRAIVRNGYSAGSHSEIEVSRLDEWGPDQVRERGLKLLGIMEIR